MVDCGTLTVEPEFDSFAFEVISCPAPGTLVAGEQTTIDVTVANNNPKDGVVPVSVQGRPPGETGNQNNVELAKPQVTVPANASETVTAQFTVPEQEGDWSIIANAVEATPATATAAAARNTVRQSIGRLSTASKSADKGTLATAGAGVGTLALAALSEWR